MLNHAAAVIAPRIWNPALRISSVVLLASCFLAAPVFALDGIDLSKSSEVMDEAETEAPAEGACSRLVEIKYPFLSCTNGEIGQADADELWENSRRIPMGSAFVEGNGYWGEDLNTY